MKQQIVRLTGDYEQHRAFQALGSAPLDGSRELVIRDASVSKSQAQLGALFGLWMRELEDQTGHSTAELHATCKDLFLVDLILAEPMSDIQELWAENYASYQHTDPARAQRCRAMVSISDRWGMTKEQMKQYMDSVWAHFTSKGFSLTIPDRFKRAYK